MENKTKPGLLEMLYDVKEILDGSCNCAHCDSPSGCMYCFATAMYNAGYRKVENESKQGDK